MAIIQPEVTGRDAGRATAESGSGHNRRPPLSPSIWVELKRIVDLKEASRLSGLSVDSIKRHYRQNIIELSPRRLGMRVGDALMLGQPP
jgi:hypothetical protein